jgi:hypothetical protein
MAQQPRKNSWLLLENDYLFRKEYRPFTVRLILELKIKYKRLVEVSPDTVQRMWC